MARTVRPSTLWREARRQRDAQVLAALGQANDALADHARNEAAADGFDFGQLGHAAQVPRSEQRAADADMGGAEPHGRLVVGAHAHADLGEAVARGHLGQQGEMQRRLLVDRRDAHQPDDRQLVDVAAGGDEGVEIGRQDARLLRLLAGIDLDEAGGPLAGPFHLLGERAGQALAVDRLDDVEQGHGIARLVGLQRTDQVQLEVGIFGLERGKLLLRLLHAVLAEHALAGVEQLADAIGAMGLGDGDQGDVGRAAGRRPSPPRRCGWLDLRQVIGALAHASRLARAVSASSLFGLAASALSSVSRARSFSPSAARQMP